MIITDVEVELRSTQPFRTSNGGKACQGRSRRTLAPSCASVPAKAFAARRTYGEAIARDLVERRIRAELLGPDPLMRVSVASDVGAGPDRGVPHLHPGAGRCGPVGSRWQGRRATGLKASRWTPGDHPRLRLHRHLRQP